MNQSSHNNQLSTERKIRVNIPEGWISTQPRKITALARYLLGLCPKPDPKWSRRTTFSQTMSFDATCELSEDPDGSDFILYPYYWTSADSKRLKRINTEINRISSRSGKPILLHGATPDVLAPKSLAIPFDTYIYLNSALIRSRMPHSAYPFPFFTPDISQELSSEWRAVNTTDIPTVGFCGVASPLGTKLNKTTINDYIRLILTYTNCSLFTADQLLRAGNNNSKHAYRVRLIKSFSKSKGIKCSFIVRPEGGLVTNDYYRKENASPYIQDYLESINSNLYTICCRGTENYSARLYEVLCMGRIPIIVDTDTCIPFLKNLSITDSAVIIHPRDISEASSILLDWHFSHSASDLIEIQRYNRKIWLSHYSHELFYKRLSEYYQANTLF